MHLTHDPSPEGAGSFGILNIGFWSLFEIWVLGFGACFFCFSKAKKTAPLPGRLLHVKHHVST